MIIGTEKYMGYQLALKKNAGRFQVAILDASNRLVVTTEPQEDAAIALADARREIESLRANR